MPEQFSKSLSDILQAKLQNGGQLKSDHDKAKFERFLGGTQKGLEGLSYLRGHKYKEVDHMYDEAPVNAVARNAANNAGTIGTGIAGLSAAGAFYKDRGNRLHMNQAFDRMSGNTDEKSKGKPIVDIKNRKPGENSHAAEQYTKWLDERVDPSKQTITDPKSGNPIPKYQDLKKGTKIKGVEPRAKMPPGMQAQQADGMSKFFTMLENKKPYLGDDDARIARTMHDAAPKVFGKGKQPLTADASTVEMLNRLFGEERSGNIASHVNHLGNPRLSNYFEKSPGSSGGLMEGLKSKARDFFTRHPGADINVGQRVAKGISMLNNRGVKGGLGVAAGGMAIAPILKYIQNKYYGDEQMRKWTEAARQVKGKFD